MSALTECVGTSVPHEFVHRNKTYSVQLITQAVKAGYEKKFFARAKEAAAAMRELMDKADYSKHLKELNDDYISGAYAFESPKGLAALQTVSGMLILCSLLFGCDETELLQLVNERREEVTSLIELLIRESFPVQEEADPLTGSQGNQEGSTLAS